MRPIQLSANQPLHRPAAIARRSTKSERMSRSQLHSMGRRRSGQAGSAGGPIEGRAGGPIENAEQLDIYFDKAKRRCYFKSVIDHYFVPHDTQAHCTQDSEPCIAVAPPLLSRACISSESSRAARAPISISRLKLKSRISLLDFSMPEMSSLPVIEEGLQGQKRPSSVHQPSSFLSLDKSTLFDRDRSALLDRDRDAEESLFYESNPSLLENSQLEKTDSFKLVTIRKAGQRFGKAKVYSSQDNQQLQRENSAKKVGMKVLWTPSNTTSLEFPAFRSLRELCCSIVQDRNGDEPVSLLYPTPYYASLFANQCEELVDIVVELARGVAAGQGMVANNQIHMRNVVKRGEKQFVLADWGCASIREGFTVQGRTFNKDLGALCRDGNKWLVSPEYLSPEMLRAAQSGLFEQLWRQRGGVGSCDVWSIGCLVFELVTLVPLDSPHYCIVKGRERRRGLFGFKLKAVDKILGRQRGFKNYVVRSLKEEMRLRKDLKLNEKLLELLPRMLEESPENRVTAEEILLKLA